MPHPEDPPIRKIQILTEQNQKLASKCLKLKQSHEPNRKEIGNLKVYKSLKVNHQKRISRSNSTTESVSEAPSTNLVEIKSESNLEVSTNPQNQCSTCYKIFEKRYYLTKHLLCHGEKKFECQNCDKKFKRSDFLQVHIRAKHSGISNFQCNICQYSTPYKQGLEKHISKMHKD